MTIDFYVKKCPNILLGISPYVIKPNKTLYILFVGIRNDYYRKLKLNYLPKYNEIFDIKNQNGNYFPIQFSPSDKPLVYLFWHKDNLNNKICEMFYDIKKDEWKLHKIREDRDVDVKTGKYFGNDFRIAELTWNNYSNPLTYENLKLSENELLQEKYFQEDDTELYKPLRSYHSFIKSELFETFKESEYVIDIGSGKGQDMFRYAKYGIKNVLFIDKDKDALSELLNRKYVFAKSKDKTNMKIYIQNMDINSKWYENVKQLENNDILSKNMKGKIPIIICNFAIHYFMNSKLSITNLINFVKYYLMKGGKFIFTAFNGDIIYDLLKKNNGVWNSYTSENILKYSIKSNYNTKNFTGINQQISVKLPFSKDEYYVEWLVNTDYLINEFKKTTQHSVIKKDIESKNNEQFNLKNNKLQINECNSFDIYLDKFKKQNKKVYDKLDDNDKFYTSLHKLCIFIKR